MSRPSDIQDRHDLDHAESEQTDRQEIEEAEGQGLAVPVAKLRTLGQSL